MANINNAFEVLLAQQQCIILDGGLATELEAQMAHVVGTYACEWKKTLQDPQKLKRFRQFVNSDETDNGVVFVREREQIRPARPDERLRLVAVTK